jgi:ribonucleotide monophosphatase NagD (HAD superfamily)
MNDAQITDRPRHLYDAYILDLDGTVYLGDALLPGAQEVVTELMSRDIPRLYLSNNPTRDREMYVRKLNDLGIPARPEEVITTVFTTTQWLLQNAPDATVFPIAEEPLIRALHAAGSPVMLRTIGQALGIELERSLIVGDRLYTEIRMGIEAGVDTALVLTGETDLPMLSETAGRFHPTYVLPSIAEILPSP